MKRNCHASAMILVGFSVALAVSSCTHIEFKLDTTAMAQHVVSPSEPSSAASTPAVVPVAARVPVVLPVVQLGERTMLVLANLGDSNIVASDQEIRLLPALYADADRSGGALQQVDFEQLSTEYREKLLEEYQLHSAERATCVVTLSHPQILFRGVDLFADYSEPESVPELEWLRENGSRLLAADIHTVSGNCRDSLFAVPTAQPWATVIHAHGDRQLSHRDITRLRDLLRAQPQYQAAAHEHAEYLKTDPTAQSIDEVIEDNFQVTMMDSLPGAVGQRAIVSLWSPALCGGPDWRIVLQVTRTQNSEPWQVVAVDSESPALAWVHSETSPTIEIRSERISYAADGSDDDQTIIDATLPEFGCPC